MNAETMREETTHDSWYAYKPKIISADFVSEITGYSGFELDSTGLVDTYYQLLPRILGPQLTEEFAKTIDELLMTGLDTLGK